MDGLEKTSARDTLTALVVISCFRLQGRNEDGRLLIWVLCGDERGEVKDNWEIELKYLLHDRPSLSFVLKCSFLVVKLMVFCSRGKKEKKKRWFDPCIPFNSSTFSLWTIFNRERLWRDHGSRISVRYGMWWNLKMRTSDCDDTYKVIRRQQGGECSLFMCEHHYIGRKGIA